MSTKQITVFGPEDIKEAVLRCECGTKITLSCETNSNIATLKQCPTCNLLFDKGATNALAAFAAFQTAIQNSKSKMEFHIAHP